MIKRDEAKRRIVAEWYLRTKAENITNAKGIDGLMFFCFVQKEHGHLLQFRASGDKWQDVHSWLIQARLVSD
jgi:hypothetical protein